MTIPDQSFTTKIRDFDGETPLQVMAKQGNYQATSMTAQERFPYYTAFPFAWYRACDTADLAPGSVHPIRLLARDLVLWRDDDGTPHVMDAYCPHLGANLALGGRVEGCNLVCPYHWWEYDGDGRNVRIPYSDRTNGKARVRSYPTVDVNGFVMFWYHPDPAQPPLWEIPDLPEYATDEWTEPIVAAWNVRCPWQELAENGPDFVHLKTVHGAATVPEVESITYDGWFNHIRARVDFATPRGPQPGRIDTDSWGPGFGVARFSGIIDTVFLATTTPIDWEWTESIKVYKVKKLGHDADSLDRTRRVGEALVRDLRKQMAEDNVIFDNKIHVPNPALADGDGPILPFRKWAAQFYVETATDTSREGIVVKAWRVHQYGAPHEVLQLDDVDEPAPGADEVKIRVTSVTLNFNDLDGIHGRYKTVPRPVPYIPGMEVLGVVEECGAGAGAWLGQRVVAIPSGAFGGYAEHVIAPAAMTFEMPDTMPEPEAAAIFMPFHLAWLALYERARVQPGETLLVHAGAGGAGSAALQLGVHAGARVFATAGSPEKLQLCRDLGAELAINYRETDFADAVLDATGGRGVDVAFDAVSGAVTLQTFRCMAFNGRHVLAGFASGIEQEDEGLIPRPVLFGNFSLVGVCHAYVDDPVVFKRLTGFNFPAHADGDRLHSELLALFAAGKLRAIVGREVAFSELPTALRAMEERQTVGRTVVRLS